MSPPESPRRPTDAELAILAVIWERGRATVREVFEELSASQDTGYTTVLKFMHIMTDKGLLVRDGSLRPQVFRAAQPRRRMQRRLLGDLLDKAFGGSPGSMALQALSMRKATPEELRAIRSLIDRQSSDDGGAS